MILRRLARPLLASVFITGGIDTLRNPEPRIQTAQPLIDKAVAGRQDALPAQVPTDAETLVKIDAAVKVGAGLALALGKFPRMAALVLAGSMVPTTIAGHAYWEHDDPTAKAAHKTHFRKNVALIGGLLIASADTAGKPSVGWRTKRAARRANVQVSESAESAVRGFRDTLPS